jgi:hypothetical protein
MIYFTKTEESQLVKFVLSVRVSFYETQTTPASATAEFREKGGALVEIICPSIPCRIGDPSGLEN